MSLLYFKNLQSRVIRFWLVIVLFVCCNCANSCMASSKSSCQESEKLALLVFKSSMADAHGILASWDALSNCCQWKGVRCQIIKSSHSKSLHVTSLNLNNCGFDAEINSQLRNGASLRGDPSMFISSLSPLIYLKTLDLGCHRFQGSLPSNIGSSLHNLQHLDLSFQQDLSGPVPDTLYNLTNLRYLDLSVNFLIESISESIGNLTQLSELYLGTNNFTGTVPSSLQHLSLLTILDMSSNTELDLPPDRQWQPTFQLQSLDLSFCSVTGPLPAWIQTQKNLSTLTFAHNQLQGAIPSWVWTLVTDSLDLSQNQFSGVLDCAAGFTTSITSLDVSANSLTGIIPAQIANLTFNTSLSLASNSFSGSIPSFIGNLSKLQFLDLSQNNLSGGVPPSMSNLESLKTLYLSENTLSARVPAFLLQLSKLESLDMSHNGFYGPIPSSRFPSASHLQHVKMTSNKLSGEIPRNLSSLTSLVGLQLGGNDLSGGIPKDLGLLDNLVVLDLADNRLTGEIPLALSNCSALAVLSLGSNLLGGTFPECTKHLRALLALNLNSNGFFGEIPPWVGRKLNQLQILILSHNNFSGSIPPEFEFLSGMKDLGQGSSAKRIKQLDLIQTPVELIISLRQGQLRSYNDLVILAALDLSHNKLTGEIPAILGKLQGLKALNLSENNFQGSLPAGLANLTDLEALDLSINNLTGQIPPQFSSMTYLVSVNVSYNQLYGRIPSGTQWTTFSNSSFSGNKGLCGYPLLECSNDSLPSTAEQRSQLTTGPDKEGAFEGSTFWVAFAIGYPVGVLLGYLLIAMYVVGIWRNFMKKLGWKSNEINGQAS